MIKLERETKSIVFTGVAALLFILALTVISVALAIWVHPAWGVIAVMVWSKLLMAIWAQRKLIFR